MSPSMVTTDPVVSNLILLCTKPLIIYSSLDGLLFPIQVSSHLPLRFVFNFVHIPEPIHTLSLHINPSVLIKVHRTSDTLYPRSHSLLPLLHCLFRPVCVQILFNTLRNRKYISSDLEIQCK